MTADSSAAMTNSHAKSTVSGLFSIDRSFVIFFASTVLVPPARTVCFCGVGFLITIFLEAICLIILPDSRGLQGIRA